MTVQGKMRRNPAMASFLISLPQSSRRPAALRALADGGITAEVIDADDGSSMAARNGYAAWRARLLCGRTLSPGEVGCFISHRIAAARFLATPAKFGLVLEDDAVPVGSAKDGLAALARALPPLDWDLANLGAAPGFLHRPVAPLPDSVQPEAPRLLHAHYFPLGSHALLWSRDGARRFLEASTTVSYPLDHFLRRWACRSGRGLALSEPLFIPRGVPSEIDSDSFRPQLASSPLYRMRRALRRNGNKAWAAYRAHLNTSRDRKLDHFR